MADFTFEVTKTYGRVSFLGTPVWTTLLTSPARYHQNQIADLQNAFAEHLADVLNRPRPYCGCPDQELQ